MCTYDPQIHGKVTVVDFYVFAISGKLPWDYAHLRIAGNTEASHPSNSVMLPPPAAVRA